MVNILPYVSKGYGIIIENEEMKFFRHFLNSTSDEEISQLDQLIPYLYDLKYFEVPASMHHHAYTTGGLVEHSICMTRCLLELTENMKLKWKRKESPFIVGLLHDLCKCDNYVKEEDSEIVFVDGKPIKIVNDENDKWEYNNSSILTGHGDKSVIMAQKIIQLTDEEIACIRWHMGAFDDKENWNHYGCSVTKYPNVLWTHTADMMAARIYGI